MENIDEKDADEDTFVAESVPSDVDPAEDTELNEEKAAAGSDKVSRNRFKGFISRGLKGVNEDAEPTSTTESKDAAVVDERDKDMSDDKKKSKWTGIRGGIDFAAKLTLVQKEKRKDTAQTCDEDDYSREFDAVDPSETNTDYNDGDTKEAMEDTTSKKPRRSSKASKWNFAAKLKMNLKQEAAPIETKETKDDDDDDDDDKPPPDYGLLMSSFNSFQEDALEGLSDHKLPDEEEDTCASKPHEEPSQQPRRPAVRPAMDRRMVMGSFQGTSTKFDFSNHAQDSAIAVRKTKEEAAKELKEVGEESGSSLELDDDEFFDDAADNKNSSNPVDAFDVFSSISSNPPDRRMVFSSSLLREPSQRFDFNKGTSHSGTSLPQVQQEETICEEDEEEDDDGSDSEDENPAPVNSIVNENQNEEDHDNDSVNDEVEQEERKHQDYGELDQSHTTIEATERFDKEDTGESKEQILTGAEMDDGTPFLSDNECLQIDFKNGFQVCIHALVSLGESEKGNTILILNRKGVSLSKRMPQEEVAPLSQEEVSPQAEEYSRLVNALKESQERTLQAQDAVKFLQQQIHHKRHRLGDIEKKRSRSMKKLAEKNIILKR
jgi:hypothetical protein